jgi:predicted alpha/beta hydrolase family esterase
LGWSTLGGLFEKPFDFEKIKEHSQKFLSIHSDDDPYFPLEHAQFLASRLDGELKLIPGQKHFSEETDPKYTEFPALLEILLAIN